LLSQIKPASSLKRKYGWQPSVFTARKSKLAQINIGFGNAYRIADFAFE